MSKVIILNGPIGCGKDTVGEAFANREGFELTCFKEPMFRIAATTLGLDYHEFEEMYRDREWKESPNEKLNGHTVRELMIQISEEYIKPFLGQDYFGQQAAEFIRRRPWQDRFLFADGGFSNEINVLAEAGHEVILVHMYRDGCTFTNDSRSYVLTNSVPRIYTLTNNGTVEEAVDELGRIFDHYEDSREPSAEDDASEQDIPRPRVRRRPNASGSFGLPPHLRAAVDQTLNRPVRQGTANASQRESMRAAVEGFRWTSAGEPFAASAGSQVSGVGITHTSFTETEELVAAGAVAAESEDSVAWMDEAEPMLEDSAE